METRGRTLEEMARVFGIETGLAERSGVKAASHTEPAEENVEQVGVSDR